MIESCAKNLHHFDGLHAYEPQDFRSFYIEEKSKGGEGKSFFSANSRCIVFEVGKKKGPLLWSLENKKIAEGAIISHNESGYHLHILEMKSKLTSGEWAKVVKQLSGMHLSTIAAVRILDVVDIASVTCYVAYKEFAMTPTGSADMVLMKTFVGIDNPVGQASQWFTETIDLPITGSAKIIKCQRDANNDADFGVIAS